MTPREAIYLDHAATTPTDSRVVEAMLPYFTEKSGNPSSIHSFGQQAHLGLNAARETAAKALGCGLEDVVFTSGATEANNLVIRGMAHALKEKGRHIITSAIEHPCVLESCGLLEKEGFDVTYLSVDHEGKVSLEGLKEAVRKDTILISVMAANNEVGTVQPIEDIGRIAQEKGIFFHTDAVQYYGIYPCKVQEMGVSSLVLSAHKFGGPKGIGLVYLKKGTVIEPFIVGGGQEFGLRSGTQNVPGAVGMGRAMELVESEREKRKEKLIDVRKAFLEALQGINHHVNTPLDYSVPHILNVEFPGVDAAKLVVRLDLEGVAASTGSACSNIDSDLSHVLSAMGRSEEQARSSVRFSFGPSTILEEVARAATILQQVVADLRR